MTKNKLQKLKNIFSKMESHFHGESSGIDPLNCYLGLPILIKSQNEIEITKIPEEKLLDHVVSSYWILEILPIHL